MGAHAVLEWAMNPAVLQLANAVLENAPARNAPARNAPARNALRVGHPVRRRNAAARNAAARGARDAEEGDHGQGREDVDRNKVTWMQKHYVCAKPSFERVMYRCVVLSCSRNAGMVLPLKLRTIFHMATCWCSVSGRRELEHTSYIIHAPSFFDAAAFHVVSHLKMRL